LNTHIPKFYTILKSINFVIFYVTFVAFENSEGVNKIYIDVYTNGNLKWSILRKIYKEIF